MELQKCTSVWLRLDCVKQALEAPYTGPHRVIKLVVFDVSNQEMTVSLAHLEPCSVPPSEAKLETIGVNNKEMTVSLAHLKACCLPPSQAFTGSSGNPKNNRHTLYCLCDDNREMNRYCKAPCSIQCYQLECGGLRRYPRDSWSSHSCQPTNVSSRVTFQDETPSAKGEDLLQPWLYSTAFSPNFACESWLLYICFTLEMSVTSGKA